MGSSNSRMTKCMEISYNMIRKMYGDKIILASKKVLYFADDIKNECIIVLTDIRNNNKIAAIYYYKSIIYGIKVKDDHVVYISSKIKPTSIGYMVMD